MITGHFPHSQAKQMISGSCHGIRFDQFSVYIVVDENKHCLPVCHCNLQKGQNLCCTGTHTTQSPHGAWAWLQHPFLTLLADWGITISVSSIGAILMLMP